MYIPPAVYKEPYLLVYCESGLEVYDIGTAKWIQTIPIRKVTVIRTCDNVWFMIDVTVTR